MRKSTLLGALLALFVHAAVGSIGAAGHAVGGIGSGSSGSGFLPAGHFIVSPISSTVIPVFPLGDNVTSATGRIHQAYWDGTNDVGYDVALGDEFGAYPYICTLVQGPPGMTVEQSTYTTFRNPDYCRVLWHPQGNISSAWNGEVEVAVTDQQHNTIDMSWALWTVGQYTTSSFSGTATVNGSSTLTISGSCTGSITPGTVLAGTDIAAGTYVAFDLTGTGCDGTYALSTAATGSAGPESITGSYAQGAVFVSTTGSGSTCSYNSPCSLTQAFGGTWAATSYPGAICYAFGGTYSATAATFTGSISGTTLSVTGTPTGTIAIGQNISSAPNTGITEGTTITGGSGTTWTVSTSQTVASQTIYGSTNLPAYTDTITYGSATPTFELYASRKPNALIGIPGQTATLDASAARFLVVIGGNASDWYMENITANGYLSGVADSLIQMSSSRITFDQVDWVNSGYGLSTGSNMSMFQSGGETQQHELFITDSLESNRESGSVGNNYAFADIYDYGNSLIQRNSENSPGADVDGSFYYKSDVTYSTMRENYLDVANSAHGFDYGQAQNAGIGNNESIYNFGVNINQLWIDVAGTLSYTWQPIAIYRNTIISGAGQGLRNGAANVNLSGPWISATTSASGGSLTPGDVYYLGMTSVGVSGESQMVSGSYGNASGSPSAGSSNIHSLTLGSGDGSADISFFQEPGAVSNDLYGGLAQSVSSISCTGTTITVNTTSAHGLSTGAIVHQDGFTPTGWDGTPSITVTGGDSYTYTVGSCPGTATVLGVYAPMQLIASGISPSAGSYTWTGTAPSATYPPTSNTALSAYRSTYYGNAVSTSYTPAPPPTGSAITNGTGSLSNVIDPGTGAVICTSVTTGCAAVGDLNTTYSGYGTTVIPGEVGYQIQ